MTALTAESTFPRRFGAYLAERFPLGSYGLLTALYVAGAWAIGARSTGAAPVLSWRLGATAALVLLVFLHLRLFDEAKDHETDRLNHPERLVQRGIVTLGELAHAARVTLVLEAGLALALGSAVALIWAATLGFSLLMRHEFGAGAWLRPRPLTYAVTHQPIMLLVAALVQVAAGVDLAGLAAGPLLAYQALSLGGMFTFEIARKLRAPADERPHERTYTTAHGPAGAALVATVLWTATAGAAAVLIGKAALVLLVINVAFVRFGRAPTRARAAQAASAATAGLAVLHALVTWKGWFPG